MTLYHCRLRLANLEKPTIVKSLKNGRWYCGLGVTQGNGKFAAQHWDYPPHRASLNRTTYGSGKTADEAYIAWRNAWWWQHRSDPNSVM